MVVAEAIRHSANISTSEYIPDTRLLKYVCRFEYGESLADETRVEGPVPIMGSNGQFATHTAANTGAPVIIVGRKGSFGKLTWSDQPVFAIDTTFYVDASCTRANLRWLYYALQTLHLDSSSQDAAVPGLNREEAYSKHLVVPSLEQQGTIAVYLDRETARIDDLIATNERLLNVLAEKRQALITRAVTRGLDTSVCLKNSGIAWLDKIPTHWNLVPLKYLASIQTGVTLGKRYVPSMELEVRPYLRVANVQDGYINIEDVANIAIPANEIARYELRAGDVLLTEGGDLDKLGRGQVWHAQIEGCLHQNHIFAVRPFSEELLPEFLAALTSSTHGKNYFTSTGIRTTNLATTNSSKVMAFPIPTPSIQEQRAILNVLEQEQASLLKLVNDTNHTIGILRERRLALVAVAVTGQIDTARLAWK